MGRSGNRNITLLRRESLSIEAGGVLFFDGGVLHASGAYVAEEEVGLAAENHRYAIVLHYASKGELDRTENDPVLRATHAPYMRGGRT